MRLASAAVGPHSILVAEPGAWMVVAQGAVGLADLARFGAALMRQGAAGLASLAPGGHREVEQP